MSERSLYERESDEGVVEDGVGVEAQDPVAELGEYAVAATIRAGASAVTCRRTRRRQRCVRPIR